jgi:hypothetical protein
MVHRSGAGTLAGSGSGSSRMIAVIVSALVRREKARLPAHNSYSTNPSEN